MTRKDALGLFKDADNGNDLLEALEMVTQAFVTEEPTDNN
jgi:hypothetical protein